MIIYSKLLPGAKPLARGSKRASGWDLCANENVCIHHGLIAKVRTGVCIELPSGYEGQVRPRSGLSAKGVWVKLGTVDEDYRGEISVVLGNFSGGPYDIVCGDRIAQLVIAAVPQVSVEYVESLTPTERGEKGFGSSGR